MYKNAILSFLLMLCWLCLSAQTPTYRLKFRYRITKAKLAALNKRGIYLKDRAGTSLGICSSGRVLKCVITNDKGELIIDPWAISDNRVNPNTTAVDPCYNSVTAVNSNTPYPLTIDIRRGQRPPGAGVVVGFPTKAIGIHYQTWLIGVNTQGVKFRPKVKDYNGNEYSGNAITGSINAGLTVGYSFGWTKFTHRSTSSWSATPAFALGFASASLSKEPLKKQVIITYNPSNFIVSPAIGCIIARNDIGLMFTYGKDYMTGKNAGAWAYQRKGFFGIGLSASFKL